MSSEGSVVEEFKAYLDRKMRLGKLDSALLFLSSSVGLIFAITQSLAKPPGSLSLFAPVFFLGWILPFYYGYVKGALVRDSIVDRYRGWIYFITGLGMYFVVATTQPFLDQINPVTFSPVQLIVPGIFSFMILTGILFMMVFTKFIYGLGNERPNVVTLRVAFFTGSVAAFIALTGWFFSRFQNFNVYSFVFLLIVALPILWAWDKSDYYAAGARNSIQYKVVPRSGRLHGKRVPQELKRLFVVVTYVVFGIAAFLTVLQFDLLGITLVLVEAGFLLLLPTLALTFVTRTNRVIEFVSSPRKQRRQVFPELIRRAIAAFRKG
jgi:hypothetical protein